MKNKVLKNKTDFEKDYKWLLNPKNMRIAFDADNVLVPFDIYFMKFMQQRYGSTLTFNDMTSHYYAEVFDLSLAETEKRVREFYKTYFNEGPRLPLIAGVSSKTRALKEEGHDLIIITSRVPELEDITKTYFDSMTPGIFSKIRHSANTFVGNSGFTKAEICQEENVDLMIDDVPKYLADCVCDTLLFGTYPWNLDYEGPRVETFSQIPNYIVNLEKSILEVK